MALVISKHIELKSGISMRRFVDEAEKFLTGIFYIKSLIRS